MSDHRPDDAESDPVNAAASPEATPESDPVADPASAVPVRDNVARNSAIMAIGTFGSRILGFVRTAMLTGIVGVNALTADSFSVANSLPTQLYVLINGGLLSAVLIPQLTKAMLRKDGGQDFSDRLITLCLLVLAGTTVASLAAAPWIVRLLTDNEDEAFLSLTTKFALLCLPQIFFYGLYSVLGQVLNARGNFSAYAWAPAWANVIQIAGLAWFIVEWGQQTSLQDWSAEMIWVLAGSTTLGIVVQGVGLVVPLVKSGFRYRPRFGWRGHGFRDLSRMAMWTIAALLISQAYGFLSTYTNSSGAARADNVPGNYAQALAYGLYILPHSIITISLITALFPAMSRAHEQGDLAAMRRQVVNGLKTPSVLLIPATAALLALGRPIAATLFPGSAYDADLGIDDAADVGLIMGIMGIGLVPFGITALKQRYCFARGDGKMNFWTVVVLMAGNALGCVVALLWSAPEYVVMTVAAGASISNFVAAAVFIVIARRQLGGLGMSSVVRLWVRLVLVCAIGGVAAWGIATLVADPGDAWVTQALAVAAGLLALGLVYLAGARLLRIREVDELLAPILRRVRLAR
ncbi:putative peptidoglycan lipid II flippase [Knoellia remsis]|uniref:Putative peptidoglycan lipid II flippase n=1 Tax=Knoellia remsis TaxID=407159 RepID=A0A2T0UJG0_9MICO|nr:murein biosynthesis integral membrane protein MurJ [Knoellia remsis]PRY58042.1 putative peptidoglycan lipid II flippase [Knoellia remsis]